MNDVSDRPEAKEDTLLTPLEAAQHLGITPELLFFYTSKSFQKRPGTTRRLSAHSINGSTRFAQAELDAFDHYLREPWADKGEKRRDPPKKILAYLHAESGGACTRCGSGAGVETAHIDAWATSHSNHHHNLLRICSACHDEHDLHNSLPTEELRRLKATAIDQLRTKLQQRLGVLADCPLPAPDPLFVGRAIELEELREALRTERFILVRGPGGAGKTELVLQALANMETGRAVFWIEAERYGNIDAMRGALEVAIRGRTVAPTSTDLIGQLDAVHACLVFDGVEQLQGPALDAIDDWISELQAKLHTTQVLVTSQVDLQRACFDRYIYLHGLDAKASKRILEHFVRPGIPVDSHIENLVTFADGHPLTLKLTAMLVNFFGSGRSAYEQIERRGVELLEIQKRSSLDRRTSLRVCLSLAYEALTPDEQQLLFLVANAPGGLFSVWIESGHLGIANAQLASAGVRRWSLLQVTAPGKQNERYYVLSPIASYVISRWQTAAPNEAHSLAKELARHFAIMAAAIDSRSGNPIEIPYMVDRFKLELPNLLRVFDFAEREPEDAELSQFAGWICSALIRYFFITRLGATGSRLMLRGARIAIRDGKPKKASALLTQMVGLALRNNDRSQLDGVMALLNELERETTDAELRGNIALARGLAASLAGNAPSAEIHARSAISYFESAMICTKQETDCIEESAVIDVEGIENNLSSSFSLLGDGLLAQGLYSDSAAAYHIALSWLRGASIAVNDGQLHHQIGNCESHLGNHKEAANSYKIATERFHSVGMHEYLSNSLSELGHTLLALGNIADLPALPNASIITDGLADIAADLIRCYADIPFDLETCSRAIRKLFGLLVLASVNNQTQDLEELVASLDTELIEPALSAIDVVSSQKDKFALYHLEVLLVLASAIADFERSAESNEINDHDVEMLAKLCHHQGPWGGIRTLSFQWLSFYLNHRWGLEVGTGDELRAAADHAAAGAPFTLRRNF